MLATDDLARGEVFDAVAQHPVALVERVVLVPAVSVVFVPAVSQVVCWTRRRTSSTMAVFTAGAVARAARDRTGLAIRNLVRPLRTLRSATIKLNARPGTLAPEITTSQPALLDALRPAGGHALSE